MFEQLKNMVSGREWNAARLFTLELADKVEYDTTIYWMLYEISDLCNQILRYSPFDLYHEEEAEIKNLISDIEYEI